MPESTWFVDYLIATERGEGGGPPEGTPVVTVEVRGQNEREARDAARIAIMRLHPDGIKWERDAGTHAVSDDRSSGLVAPSGGLDTGVC